MSNLTAKALVDHLKLHVTRQARVIPGRLPELPNRVISVVLTSGAGFQMDGLFDAVGFSVTCRGGENNFADAEAIANEVDDVLTGKAANVKSMSFFLGNVYVDVMGRTGSGPTQLAIPDIQSRFMFTCNYYAQVATDIGQVS